MERQNIELFATEARENLLNTVIDNAGNLGISEKEIKEPYSEGNGFFIYQNAAGIETILSKIQNEQRDKLITRVKKDGFKDVMEEIAYTWFNRIIAIRFMEVNDYLPSRLRVLSSDKKGKREPDIVTNALECGLNNIHEKDREYILQLQAASKLDELFKFMFIKQCNELNSILPELFEVTNDYTELLLTLSFTNEDGIIAKLLRYIDEEMFDVNSGGQVEIIGWLYQAYNAVPKEKLINSKKVYLNNEIPYVTQIFTPEWIVKYMVENTILSLCKIDTGKQFEYYINDKNTEKLPVENIKFLDPCMGSGHILVYAFDVFMDLYLAAGYDKRDAAIAILKNNLYGLDIDKRAYQLTYFSLIMKARQFNRRIFSNDITLNVYQIKHTRNMNELHLKEIFGNIYDTAKRVIQELHYADEIGSLLVCEKKIDYTELKNKLDQYSIAGQMNLSQIGIDTTVADIRNAINVHEILANKFEVVVTNPPYLNSKYMPKNLKEYLDVYYKDNKADSFAAFMMKCFQLSSSDGYVGMLTPYVWMFLGSFQKLRKHIITEHSITTLTQLEYNAFEAACVPVCTFVIKNKYVPMNGTYIKLSDFKGADVQGLKTYEAIHSNDCEYKYLIDQKEFLKIPESPIAYWISKGMIDNFAIGQKIEDFSDFTGSQHKTANNDVYLRYFWEVPRDEINRRWITYAKGGTFRRWYGNLELLVDWSQSAIEYYKNNPTSNLIAENYRFVEGITYTSFSSTANTFRYLPATGVFDIKGPSLVKVKHLYYILALLNSIVAEKYLKFFNSTATLQVKDVKRLPIIISRRYIEEITELSKRNVEICKEEWDFHENSMEFNPQWMWEKENIELSVKNHIAYVDALVTELNENENRINQMFYEIYSTEPMKSSSDLNTINHIDELVAVTDILLYFIGDALGRYSYSSEDMRLEVDSATNAEYKCIAITDEEYVENDIICVLEYELKKYFAKSSVEENINYIAQVINKGKPGDSKSIIRNYFMKEFYKKQCKVFSKTPVYWQVDSGKANGCKVLFYIHNYNADTLGIIRTETVHKIQSALLNAKNTTEYVMENTTLMSEKSRSKKRIDNLVKQINEIQVFDEALAHLANKRINLDYTRGVKYNYELFQHVTISNEGMKNYDINILTEVK